MRPIARLHLLALLLLAASANGQYGYLGRKNLISVDPVGPFTMDAYSAQYTRVLNQVCAVRFEFKSFHTDRALNEGEYGEPSNSWLGLASNEDIGTVSGKASAFGFQFMYTGPTGLSLPLGFYGTFGVEFVSSSFTEEYLTAIAPYQNQPKRMAFDFEGHGTRLIFGFGETMILFANVTLDLGIECGPMWYRFTSIDSGLSPKYTMPYDHAMLFGNLNTDLDKTEDLKEGDTEFQRKGAFFLEPRMRLGYVF